MKILPSGCAGFIGSLALDSRLAHSHSDSRIHLTEPPYCTEIQQDSQQQIIHRPSNPQWIYECDLSEGDTHQGLRRTRSAPTDTIRHVVSMTDSCPDRLAPLPKESPFPTWHQTCFTLGKIHEAPIVINIPPPNEPLSSRFKPPFFGISSPA